MAKYYEAYDERYKKVHQEGLSWSINKPTKLIEDIINKYHLEKAKILEIGCGEGRDAKYLLEKGYNVTATDISKEAVNYCINNDKNHKDNYKVFNILDDEISEKYDFIYSVAVLHMLVEDADRNRFYKQIFNSLNDNGYSLILTMGDGLKESKSDINKAFDMVKRIHQETNKEIEVATTSCRVVNFKTFFSEISNNNFKIIEHGITDIPNHFDKMMYALIKKDLD